MAKGYVGGLIGYNNGNIEKSSNTGNINCIGSSSSKYTGGIAGSSGTSSNPNGSKIELCYNLGDISSNGQTVGGISGSNFYSSKIINCYSRGAIISLGQSSSHSLTGGVVGSNSSNSTVENAYHVGNITANYTYVGGIVGYNGNSSSGTQIVKNVFNEGTIKCGSQTATADVGSGLGTLIGIYGSLTGKHKNTSKDEMKDWDEETININLGSAFTKDINNINDGYPILK